MEETVAARTAERVAEVERALNRKHEEAVAAAVGRAVAAVQARQAAGFSIPKSAVKVITRKKGVDTPKHFLQDLQTGTGGGILENANYCCWMFRTCRQLLCGLMEGI